MTHETDDPIDRLIDHAARGMTMGEPSAQFEDLLQARLKRPRSVPLLSGFHVDGIARGFQVAVTATVVVALVLFVWLARRPAQPSSTAAGMPAACDIPLAESPTDTSTSVTQPGTVSAQRQRAGRRQLPLPPIEPLTLEPLALELIDEALPVDLAALEVAPLRLDPMGTVTLKENQ